MPRDRAGGRRQVILRGRKLSEPSGAESAESEPDPERQQPAVSRSGAAVPLSEADRRGDPGPGDRRRTRPRAGRRFPRGDAGNFVKIGIHPGFGLTFTLPRLIGQQRAALMLLTGRRIDGETAVAWGLADQLSTPEKLRDDARSLAAEMAENAPLAVVSTRATLRAKLADMVEAQTRHELAEQTRLMKTADHREGIKAVAERRAGNFVGR